MDKKISECRQHWTGFILHGILAFFSFMSGISGITEGGDNSTEAAVLSFAVALLFVLYIFISYKFTYIRLTDKKIEGHTGFIKSKTLSTPLSKVQSIGLSNGLMGKIFKYHTITIDNAGTSITEYKFKRMAHAKEFVQSVEKEIEANK